MKPEPIPQELLAAVVAADEARVRGESDWASSTLPDVSNADLEKLSGLLACMDKLASAADGSADASEIFDTRETDRRMEATRLADVVPHPTSMSVPIGSEVNTRNAVSDSSEYAGYHIGELLGQGGFGVVYRAHDPKLGRDVAIKIPLPSVLACDSACERFQREARAAAAMQHPNIVVVYETLEDRQPGIVYEYCDGGTLSAFARCQGEALPEPLVLEIVICIAKALRSAHSRGVLHRDLKPSNILLCSADLEDRKSGFEASGDWWVPKIADFGLARIVDEQSEATQTNMVMGTPRFMAPEQASGSAKESGTFTDVFSFGSVLYWLLAGVAPFDGPTQVATLVNIELKDPQPLRKIRPEISRDLESVCLKCLQKPVSDRYESSGQLLNDLIAVRDGSPISIRPASVVKRLRQWHRSHRVLSAILSVLLLAVVAGVAIQVRHADAQQHLIAQLDETNVNLSTTAQRESDLRGEAETREVELRHLLYTTKLRNAAHLAQLGRPSQAWRELVDYVESNSESEPDDFVFRYFRASCNRQLHSFTDHHDQVLATAYAEKRGMLATGDKEGVIFIRSADDGQVTQALESFPGEVRDLEFSPNEEWLVASGTGDLLRLYDTKTWKVLKDLKGQHDGTIMSIVFTPDGRQLISGSRDDYIFFWNTDSWTVDRKIRAHDTVMSVSLSGDGRWLVTGGHDCCTKTWNVGSGEIVLDQQTHNAAVLATAISDDGRFVASGGYDHHVSVWDRTSGTEHCHLSVEQTRVLRFLSGGKLLTVATAKGAVEVYDVTLKGKPRLIRSFPDSEFAVRSMATLKNPPRFLAAYDNGSIRITSGPSGRLEKRHSVLTTRQIAFAPDDRRFALGHGRGMTTIYDRNGGLLETHHVDSPPEFDSSRLSTVSLAFPRQKTLHSACIAGNEVRWHRHLGDGGHAETKLEHSAPVVAICLSSDAKLLASYSGDVIRIWVRDTGQCLQSRATSGTVNVLTFAADNRLLAFVTDEGHVSVWDLASGRTANLPSTTDQGLYAVAFSSDGRFLAASGFAQTAWLWDLHTNELIADLPIPNSSAALSFSSDGQILAVAGSDIRLFDVKTKQLLLTLGKISLPAERHYEALAFSADDSCLIAVRDTLEGSLLSIWDTASNTPK